MRWVRSPGRTGGLVAVAAGVAGLVWVGQQAFVADGLFANRSDDGPQRTDALALVVGFLSLLATLAGLWLSYLRGSESLSPGVLPPDAVPDHDAGPVPHGSRIGEYRLGEAGLATRFLRVHQAIDLPSGTADAGLDPDLPTWIPRQEAGPRVMKWMADHRRLGGLLVLVGNPSVGKTRLLYEAAVQIYGGWPVVIPPLGNGTQVKALAARASVLTEPLVVWLDDLHRFVPGPDVLDRANAVKFATVHALLQAPVPVVVLASLWPEHHGALTSCTSQPKPNRRRRREPGSSDDDEKVTPVYPDAAQILQEACVIRVEGFNEAEVVAAQRTGDPRLTIAVNDPNFGVTQVLAGAPQLMRRVEASTDEERALLWAAIDLQRIGISPPFSADLIAAAARGYLRESHPTDTWATTALRDLSRSDGPHDRATAPLLAVPDAERRCIIGYEVADYLLQFEIRRRRSIRLSDVTWRAATDYTLDEGLLLRLADNAQRRNRLDHAEAALLKVVHADGPGASRAARLLPRILAERGDIDQLRSLGEAGDTQAGHDLALSLAGRGDLGTLRELADAGDINAGWELGRALVAQGRFVELRARADAGDRGSGWHLAVMLIDGDELDELRARADEGDPDARRYLMFAKAERGELDELRIRANGGFDPEASSLLAELLGERGEVVELNARADAGDRDAARCLKRLELGHIGLPELRDRADEGDTQARQRLASVLAERGAIDELRERADGGDLEAVHRLVVVLAERGLLDELRVRADGGDPGAARHLLAVLAEHGDVEALHHEVEAGTHGALATLRAATQSH